MRCVCVSEKRKCQQRKFTANPNRWRRNEGFLCVSRTKCKKTLRFLSHFVLFCEMMIKIEILNNHLWYGNMPGNGCNQDNSSRQATYTHFENLSCFRNICEKTKWSSILYTFYFILNKIAHHFKSICVYKFSFLWNFSNQTQNNIWKSITFKPKKSHLRFLQSKSALKKNENSMQPHKITLHNLIFM